MTHFKWARTEDSLNFSIGLSARSILPRCHLGMELCTCELPMKIPNQNKKFEKFQKLKWSRDVSNKEGGKEYGL